MNSNHLFHRIRRYSGTIYAGLVVFGGLFLSLASPCNAQENLPDILRRGYFRDWLVCGPFDSDVEGGAVAAIEAGIPALGTVDYMKPVGGITQVRPTPFMSVQGAEAVWQAAAMTGPVIDFSPFFRERREGIAYAASYFQTAQPAAVFFTVHSPLNVRIWMNGIPFRDIQAKSIEEGGIDRFALEFPAGKHLVIVEIPVIALDRLAEAVGMSERALLCGPYTNRTLLPGKNGYEMGLEIKPAMRMGDVFYIPELRDTSILSGSLSDIRQEMMLTFFNAGKAHSPQINLTVSPAPQPPSIDNPQPPTPTPITLETPAIPPYMTVDQILPVPINGVPLGQLVQATVALNAGGNTGSFNTSFRADHPGTGARAHLLAGWILPDAADAYRDQTEKMVEATALQTILSEQSPNYGFMLGAMEDWLPFFAARPDLAEILRPKNQPARGEALAGFGHPDERFVSGEMLWRNLVYGRIANQTWLGRTPESVVLQRQPGMAPQTPYLAHLLNLTGIAGYFDFPGFPSVFQNTTPEGSYLPIKPLAAPLNTAKRDDFYRNILLERRGLLNQGLPVDLMVEANTGALPEFFHTDITRLGALHPSVLADGAAADSFFRNLAIQGNAFPEGLPSYAWPLNTAQPGTLFTRPGLRDAWNRTETLLRHTETFATFAALLGAEYPESILDSAWRNLIFWSHPDRLGINGGDTTLLDGYGEIRDTYENLLDTKETVLTFIANEVNTLGTAPNLGQDKNVRALLAFNPSPHARTGLCSIETDLNGMQGLSLVDDMDEPVPFLLDRVQYGNQLDILHARIRFTAAEVPGIGYRTYYIRPSSITAETPIEGRDSQIENDFFRLEVNPETGDITHLIVKATGKEYLAGASNRVIALAQDPQRIQGGRELWTTGDNQFAGAKTSLRSIKTSSMQTLHIRNHFLGGSLDRTITLWRGTPWISCETSLDKPDTKNHPVVMIAVDPPAPNARPVLGDRFCAITGEPGTTALDYRTAGLDQPSGARIYPALHWAAAAPTDRLRVSEEKGIPLGPTLIITGDSPHLRQAADTLLTTWAKQGYPCAIEKDSARKPDFPDSANTAFPRLDLNRNAHLRLILGGPGDNRYTEQLLKTLSADERKAVEETLRNGGALIMPDRTLPDNRTITAIVIGGDAPETSAKMVRNLCNTLVETHEALLPTPYIVEDPTLPSPDRGIALLFESGRAATMDPDGRLLMGWMTADGDSKNIPPQPATIRYALYPFDGNWRDSDIPEKAQDFSNPFQATLAELKAGKQPRSQAFLTLNDRHFVLDTVKCAGFASAEMRNEARHPRDGFIVRGFEPSGRPYSGSITTFIPLLEAAFATPEEKAAMKLAPEGKRLPFVCKPFSMASLWLMPSQDIRKNASEPFKTEDNAPTLPSAYWRQGMGAAPAGILPLTVALQGQLTSDTPQVEAVITNHMRDTSLEGVLFVNASPNWRLDTGPQYYNLAPGETISWPLALAPETTATGDGGLTAHTYCRGVYWRDVMAEKEETPEVSIERKNDQIHVAIHNRQQIPAIGWVDLIVPPSLWENNDTEKSIAPHRGALSIDPGETQTVIFRLSPDITDPWAVAKVAVNDTVLYQPLP